MNFRNFSLLLIICFSFTQIGMTQQLTTNENGEKIIVYPDGSWEYAEEAKIKDSNEKGNPLTTLAIYKSKSDLDMAILIAESAAAEEVEAIQKAENAKHKRLLVEDELKEAERSDEYSKAEIKEIKSELKETENMEKEANTNWKKAAKKAKKASALITMDPEKRAKELNKYDLYQMAKVPQSDSDETPAGMFPGEIPPAESGEKPENENTYLADQNAAYDKVFAKYKPEEDVLFNPPAAECNLVFDGVDEFSGKKRKDVAEQLFFTHTNEELRSIFKDQDYMTCTGYLSSLTGGLIFLTLNITIASKSAQREYGILEKGSQINIKLLNGENVRLVNKKTNMGTENTLENSVSYRAQYLISSGDEKELKKSEVDKVRIIWSSGYEDYEIYELDFFIDQFNCLDK
ncbi:MAG: hypothetical protein ACI8VT_003007 [Saprospiraceae bacterium]|jgi:hypothetical protein